MRYAPLVLTGLLLGLGLACGGGSGSAAPAATAPAPTATGFTYTDPTGTGWRLVKDPASTSTRVLLNLVGPTGLMTRGVGFNLKAAAGVTFGTYHVDIPNTTHATDFAIQDLGVYELLNTDPRDPWTGDPIPHHPLEPTLLAGFVKAGNLLSVGIFQKDRRASAKDSSVPVCQIALQFDAAAGLKAGDSIALTVTKAKYQAEDIGAFQIYPTLEMVQKAKLVDLSLAVGSLRAN